MRQILFIIFLAIGISSCVQTLSFDNTELAGIKKGDKYWVLGVCKGPKAGEIYAQSVEKSNSASPELIILLKQGVCGKLPRRVPAPIERVVRSLIDWEGDEAYLVQLASIQTNEPMDIYSIVWPQTKVEEQSSGSPFVRHYHISM